MHHKVVRISHVLIILDNSHLLIDECRFAFAQRTSQKHGVQLLSSVQRTILLFSWTHQVRRQLSELAVTKRVLLLWEANFTMTHGRNYLSNHGLRAVDVLEVRNDLDGRIPIVSLHSIHT